MPTKYTEELRAEVIEHAAEHGPNAASRQFGIPAGTVSSWLHRTGRTRLVSKAWAETYAMSKAERQAIAEVRIRALETQMERVAEKALGLTLEMLENPREYRIDLHSVVGAWTRALHDLRLIRNESTENVAVADAGLDARLAAVLERALTMGDSEHDAVDTTSDVQLCAGDDPAANGEGESGGTE